MKIAINDDLEGDARDLISNNQNGEESKTAEKQRESVCVRESVWLKVRDSISHKIDSRRKLSVTDMCK